MSGGDAATGGDAEGTGRTRRRGVHVQCGYGTLGS